MKFPRGEVSAETGRCLAFCSILAIGVVALLVVVSAAGSSDMPQATSTCMGLSVGIALLVLGVTIPTRYRIAGAWAALAICGQAATLQLVDAGRRIHYQHLRSSGKVLEEGDGFLLVILALQTLVVLFASFGRLGQMWRWLHLRFRPWQLALIGSVFISSAASPSRVLSDYFEELLFAVVLQSVNLLNLVCVLWALERAQPEDLTVGARCSRISRESWLLAAAAGFVTMAAALLAVSVYEGWPHIPDEVAYVFQARTFASGRLWLPPPAVPEAFEIYTLFAHGEKWFSVFPPGWPAMLALGFLVGAPWLVNPVLGGVNVLLAHAVVRRMFDATTAMWVVLLLAASPWFVYMSMNLMSHTLALTLFLLACLWTIVAKKRDRLPWMWLAGCAIGLLFHTRPLDGLVAGGFVGILVLCWFARSRRFSMLGVLSLGFCMSGSLGFIYNWLLTEDPWVFPLDLYYEVVFGRGRYSIGFGTERGLGWPLDAFPGHTPAEGLLNTLLNLFSLNVELHGWATGSLFVIAGLVFSGRMQRTEKVLVAWLGTVMGAYFFYWYSGGPDFGPRYWYLIVIACVVLTVRGARIFGRDPSAGSINTGRAAPNLPWMLVVLSFSAMVNFVPWRALDKYYHYLYMSPDLVRCISGEQAGPALVLVKGQQHPDFAAAFSGNPLDLSLPQTVYAWDQGGEVGATLRQYYADRPVWVVEGPSLTGSGFRVVDSPLGPFECDP